MAHVTKLEAALLNLALNARDAMPDGGTLTLSVENRRIDASIATATSVRQGDYVVMRMADSGCGMPEDVIARAFEPFFTTKATGRGTGLGLGQVAAFATASGGFVTIDSVPGAGSSISIHLPRTA